MLTDLPARGCCEQEIKFCCDCAVGVSSCSSEPALSNILLGRYLINFILSCREQNTRQEKT